MFDRKYIYHGKTKLKTLKHWAEDTYDVLGTIDVRDFTADICRDLQRTLARSTKTSVEQSDKTAAREKLATFNGKRENWLNAKRELIAHLNQIKNKIGIPLYYVIRDPEEEQKYREDNGDIGR
jgi:hypothetical protein